MGLRIGREAGPTAGDALAGPAQELAGAERRDVERLGHLVVGDVEHLTQDEHRPLRRRQPFEHVERGQRDRLALLDRVERPERRPGCQGGLGQPGAHVGLACRPGRPQLIERQAAHHGGEEGDGLADVGPVGAHPPQVGVGHHVLGIPHAAQQAVRDADEARPMAVELLGGGDIVLPTGHRRPPTRGRRPATRVRGPSSTRDARAASRG